MSSNTRPGPVALAALACCALLALSSGCAADETGAPADAGGGGSLEAPAPPGLYMLQEGRAQAIGMVAERVGLEGGFWAVVDARDGDDPTRASVVAVIANPDELDPDVEELEGLYVVAEGAIVEGASIRMAGTEVAVDSITVVDESTVEDADPAEGER
jgi:hypothetical protein